MRKIVLALSILIGGIIILFIYCSLVLASISDREMEKEEYKKISK